MTWYVWTLLVLAALFALYLYLIAPRVKHPPADELIGRLYAHRGLHDGNQTVFENSPTAFRLAAEAGYGMELDVQLTADHRLIVHHDGNTKRVCGVDAQISRTAYADLPLLPDGEAIPTFDEVLSLVGGRVPLIVEVKPDGSPTANAAAAREALKAYAGPYCVESFHPMAVRYFRKNAPQVVRGQLAMGGRRNPADTDALSFYALKYLLVNVLGRPHFVAYACAEDGNLSMWLMKRLFRPLLAAWTIRDQQTLIRREGSIRCRSSSVSCPTGKNAMEKRTARSDPRRPFFLCGLSGLPVLRSTAIRGRIRKASPTIFCGCIHLRPGKAALPCNF